MFFSFLPSHCAYGCKFNGAGGKRKSDNQDVLWELGNYAVTAPLVCDSEGDAALAGVWQWPPFIQSCR